MGISSWLPFSSYPVQKPFRRRGLVSLIGFGSVLVFAGLSVWNVLTQGKGNVFDTHFSQEYVAKNATWACQSSRLNVGDLFFTNPFGSFSWLLNGVDTGHGFETGFNYAQQNLDSSYIISVGLDYSFAKQTFNYGICANATVKASTTMNSTSTSTTNSEDTVITLCTNFDLSSSNLPGWTVDAVQRIQNNVFGISQYYQSLAFPSGTFPTVSLPPYGQPGAAPPNDSTIASNLVMDLNIWLGGIQYMPISNPNLTAANGNEHPINVDGQTLTLQDAFENAVKSGKLGGLGLTVNGIGIIHLATQAINQGNGFTEPAVITQLRNSTLNSINLLLDMASIDLDTRQLGVSYLCTVSHQEWKPPISIVAVVLGNNSALFGAALTLMIAAARWFETRGEGDGESDRVPLNRHESGGFRVVRGDDPDTPNPYHNASPMSTLHPVSSRYSYIS